MHPSAALRLDDARLQFTKLLELAERVDKETATEDSRQLRSLCTCVYERLYSESEGGQGFMATSDVENMLAAETSQLCACTSLLSSEGILSSPILRRQREEAIAPRSGLVLVPPTDPKVKTALDKISDVAWLIHNGHVQGPPRLVEVLTANGIVDPGAFLPAYNYYKKGSLVKAKNYAAYEPQYPHDASAQVRSQIDVACEAARSLFQYADGSWRKASSGDFNFKHAKYVLFATMGKRVSQSTLYKELALLRRHYVDAATTNAVSRDLDTCSASQIRTAPANECTSSSLGTVVSSAVLDDSASLEQPPTTCDAERRESTVAETEHRRLDEAEGEKELTQQEQDGASIGASAVRGGQRINDHIAAPLNTEIILDDKCDDISTIATRRSSAGSASTLVEKVFGTPVVESAGTQAEEALRAAIEGIPVGDERDQFAHICAAFRTLDLPEKAMKLSACRLILHLRQRSKQKLLE